MKQNKHRHWECNVNLVLMMQLSVEFKSFSRHGNIQKGFNLNPNSEEKQKA